MTTENLKICIQKALSILPAQLEIVKLKNALTNEELKEFNRVLEDDPISDQIFKERRIFHEMDVERSNQRLKENIDKAIKEGGLEAHPITKILGKDPHILFKETMEEMKKEILHGDIKPFDTTSFDKQMIKAMTAKIFKKMIKDDKTIDEMLEYVQKEADKNEEKEKRRFIDDHTLR